MPTLIRTLRPLFATLLLAAATAASAIVAPPPAAPAPAWNDALAARLAAIDADHAGELGVYVLDLASGSSAGWQAGEPWYLASGVKVPVAVAVLRAVERGTLALDTALTLHHDDLVDGAGPTVHTAPGTSLRVDWLLEQMLVHSDNTATDVLIRAVGLDAVNAAAAELMGTPARITTLADVRRHAYAALHPAASALTSDDLLALKRARFGGERMDVLAQRLGVDRGDLRLDAIVPSYEAYYASGFNAAPLDAYARMLAAIVQGHALTPAWTAWLLDVMARAETGRHRIVAGLPDHVRFAHKTGTQLKRQCDFGIALPEGSAGVVVAACVRGAPSLSAGEAMLRAVGEAVAAAGLLQAQPLPATIHATAPATDAASAAGAPE